MDTLRPTEVEPDIWRVLWKPGSSTVRPVRDVLSSERDVFIKSRFARRTRTGVSALIHVTPGFQILPSSSTFARRAFFDRDRAVEIASKDDGTFEFRNLYGGAYTFHVIADGFEAIDARPIPAGPQNARIVLQKPGE